MIITALQLGQVVGVATLGTLYLSLAHSGPPAHAATAAAAAAALSGGILANTN